MIYVYVKYIFVLSFEDTTIKEEFWQKSKDNGLYISLRKCLKT